MHYQCCLEARIQSLYVRHSYNHCNIRWDNLLTIQYVIHSIASRKQQVRLRLRRMTGRTPPYAQGCRSFTQFGMIDDASVCIRAGSRPSVQSMSE